MAYNLNEMPKSLLDHDLRQLRESIDALPEPVANPALVVVSGLPGTGKSFFSRQLAQRLPFVVLESDALRKTLFASPRYLAEESQRLFKASHELVEEFLKKGIGVIFDATNIAERHREYLYSIADRLGAKLVIVRLEAPPEVIRERLGRRQERADPQDISDADWTVYQRMRPEVEPIRRNHFVVNTAGDVAPAIEKIVREVKRH